MVLTLAVSSPQTIARIHGTIVKIDRKRDTFMIHHDPFALMPMSMTMEVEPKRRADLKQLHVGEVIDVMVDTSIVPWPGTQYPAVACTCPMIVRIFAAPVFATLLLHTRPALADVNGTVRGTVTVGGHAAAAISVSLDGEGTHATRVTDAQGRFTFAAVTFGTTRQGERRRVNRQASSRRVD